MRTLDPPDPARIAAERRAFVRNLNVDFPSRLMVMEAAGVSSPSPAVSVLIPTADAERGGYFRQLLRQLEAQTFQDFEVIVIQGDSRQGRALNTGAAAARGEWLIILDDDTRLGHPEVFDNLVRTLRAHPDIGMAGVANTVPDDAPWLVRRVMSEIPRRHSDIVTEIIDSDMAEHPCCIIPKRVFRQIGGENEIIPRGLDPYLRREIRQAGYRVVVIPGTYIHHLPPARLMILLRQFFRNGRQAALCTRLYPQWVVELTEQHGAAVPERASLDRRLVRAGMRLLTALVTGRVIYLITTVAYQAGFVYEYLRTKDEGQRTK
ncbi:MAG: glycosyltransferase [Candidatus Latescibacteria bacterium]|nr:glycosyltransferase [Candidatus Latescibacterota bacterium]